MGRSSFHLWPRFAVAKSDAGSLAFELVALHRPTPHVSPRPEGCRDRVRARAPIMFGESSGRNVATPALKGLCSDFGVEVAVSRSFITFFASKQTCRASRSKSCPAPDLDVLTSTAADGGSRLTRESSTCCLQECPVEMHSGDVTASHTISGAHSPASCGGNAPDSAGAMPVSAASLERNASPAVPYGYLELPTYSQHCWPMFVADASGWTPGWPGSLPSLGSVGHSSGQCSPCVFFAHDCCLDGCQCMHCHMPHDHVRGKKSRPPKFVRMALRSRAAKSCPIVDDIARSRS